MNIFCSRGTPPITSANQLLVYQTTVRGYVKFMVRRECCASPVSPHFQTWSSNASSICGCVKIYTWLCKSLPRLAFQYGVCAQLKVRAPAVLLFKPCSYSKVYTRLCKTSLEVFSRRFPPRSAHRKVCDLATDELCFLESSYTSVLGDI